MCIRDRGVFGFEVVLDGTSGYGPRIESELQLMAESLRKNLGFDVQLNITEYSSNFLPNVWGKGEYEDLAYGFQGGGLDANGWLTFSYHSETRGGFYNHITDTNLDGMLDEMDQETDVEKRVQMVYDIEDYLAAVRSCSWNPYGAIKSAKIAIRHMSTIMARPTVPRGFSLTRRDKNIRSLERSTIPLDKPSRWASPVCVVLGSIISSPQKRSTYRYLMRGSSHA